MGTVVNLTQSNLIGWSGHKFLAIHKIRTQSWTRVASHYSLSQPRATVCYCLLQVYCNKVTYFLLEQHCLIMWSKIYLNQVLTKKNQLNTLSNSHELGASLNTEGNLFFKEISPCIHIHWLVSMLLWCLIILVSK